MKEFVMDGYVCKGAETRSTQSGRMVTKFTLNSPDYDRNAQKSTPAFFRCEYWHSGENDSKAAHIAEGAVLLVWGSLGYDQWEDKSGNKRSGTTFKVRELGLVRQPNVRAAQPAYGQQPAVQPYAPQAVPAPVPQPVAAHPTYQTATVAAPVAVPVPLSVYDEDIPF